MEDNIKKLKISEIDALIKNLQGNIGNMQRKIRELSERKSKLVTEGIIYNKLHKLGLITSYTQFIKL